MKSARLRLASLVMSQISDAAFQIHYSRDDDGDWVTLWDVRDLDGKVLWDSMDRDVKEWPDLPSAVALLAEAVEPLPDRGDGLTFWFSRVPPVGAKG